MSTIRNIHWQTHADAQATATEYQRRGFDAKAVEISNAKTDELLDRFVTVRERGQ